MKLATYLLLLDSASSLRFITNIRELQDDSTGAMPEQMPEQFRYPSLSQMEKKPKKIEVLENEATHPGVDSTTTIERDVKAENLAPVPNLENDVEAITAHIPVLESLRARIPVLNGMEPELKQLNKDLDDLGDFSDMDAARVGGATIRDIYHVDSLPYVNAFEKAVIKNQVREAGEVAMANQRVANWQDDFDVEKARKEMTVDQMEKKIGQLEKEADEEEGVTQQNVTTKLEPNPLYGVTAPAVKEAKTESAAPQSIVQAKDKKKSGQEPQEAQAVEAIEGAPKAEVAKAQVAAAVAAPALPQQYSPRPDGVDRLANFSVQQSMLPNSQQRKPTDFGSELERYQGIVADGKEYLKEHYGEDAPAPIPHLKSELPRSANTEITMATPSVSESIEDPIAAKIRQGVLDIEAKQNTAALTQEARARKIIANGMSDAHKLGFQEASDII